MDDLIGHSVSYRIAVGPHAGRKVFTLQTVPAWDTEDDETLAKSSGFSLHAGVTAKAHQRHKLERLCRYIARLASLVPKPRVNRTRYNGVFPSNNSLPQYVAMTARYWNNRTS